jgi:hypothetical protein
MGEDKIYRKDAEKTEIRRGGRGGQRQQGMYVRKALPSKEGGYRDHC